MSSNTLFKKTPLLAPCVFLHESNSTPLIPIEPMLREHNYHVVPQSRVSSINFGLTGSARPGKSPTDNRHTELRGVVSRYGCSRILDPLRESLMHIQTYRQWGREGQGLFPSPLPPIPLKWKSDTATIQNNQRTGDASCLPKSYTHTQTQTQIHTDTNTYTHRHTLPP